MRREQDLTNDQRRAIEFLEKNQAGMLWGGCGVGKTVSALTAAKRLIDRFDVRRILVVGPRLIAERVWSDEVTEWEHLQGLSVVRIVGDRNQRLRAMDATADIHTITRDNIAWLEECFIKDKKQYRRWPWDLVIVDESQSFKHQRAKRFKSLRRLRRLFQRCWLLTGTPIPNGPGDWWAQMYLVDGGKRLGLTETAFHQQFFKCEVRDGIPRREILPGAAEQIENAIADTIHVMRDAQPPAPTNFIKVQLTKPELAAYRKMVRTSVMEIGDSTISAVNAGVLWGKLLQLANGAVYDAQGQWHEVHQQKLLALWELLESLPRPVIVGYGFVHDVERIFGKTPRGPSIPRDLGRMAILRTGKSLDAWRRGEIDIGIMHPASAGHGLNDLYVSGAENLIWFGLTPNREFHDQLVGRIAGGHRRTGRKVCIHYLLSEGTIDEEAVRLLDFKGEQQSAAQIRVATKMKEELCAASPETTSNTKIPGSLFPTGTRNTSTSF